MGWSVVKRGKDTTQRLGSAGLIWRVGPYLIKLAVTFNRLVHAMIHVKQAPQPLGAHFPRAAQNGFTITAITITIIISVGTSLIMRKNFAGR